MLSHLYSDYNYAQIYEQTAIKTGRKFGVVNSLDTSTQWGISL